MPPAKVLLLVLLLSPILSAPLLSWLGRSWKERVGWLALLAPLTSFAACLALYWLPETERDTVRFDWVPSLGVELSFTPDGLALFFGLLVTGIGTLVTFYAIHYLDEQYEGHGRFYCTLQLFMGAMLATVFSSNLLVLFMAWELTGLTSFFLIGFSHERADSRRGARMALMTTGMTGLALLVGIVLLHQIYGTFDLNQILASTVPPGEENRLAAAFFCCFIGICGKSALFPFHYWLPNAMAAPTPVSAYLHSATLVKLGVFLTARLLPLFIGLESWMPLLVGVGFLTFLVGATLAFMNHDLKAVLAFTTVAQLGLLVGQYGWAASTGAAVIGVLHIANHTLYKACLFMVVGIIDHCAGTRDLRHLGGLFRKMPITGGTALVGLAALAGLPLSSGFLSKELLLEAGFTFQLEQVGFIRYWPLTCLAMGSVLHGLIALRIAKRAFFGTTPSSIEGVWHAPSLGIQAPPLVLALGALYFGTQPAAFGRFTASFGPSGAAVPDVALWHGWTPAALASLGIFAAAGVLFVLLEPRRRELVLPRWTHFDRGFDHLLEAMPHVGKWLDRSLGFTRPSNYLFIIVAYVALVTSTTMFLARADLMENLARVELLPTGLEAWGRWGAVLLICTSTVLAAAWKRPIPQLFAVSVTGFGIAFYFVLYRAPDLALTQLLVETATLILVLFVVLRLKRDDAERAPMSITRPGMRQLRILVSIGIGLFLGLGVLIFQDTQFEHAGAFYLENSIPLAKGANAVNTVVVDFRGFDTLLEIAVLLIAALGCLGLLHRTAQRKRREIPLPTTDLFPVPRDFILKAVALGAFVPLNLFSLHIFFRGHDAPGGGFVAGLITSLSLLLASFVLGVEGFRGRLGVAPIRIAVFGVLLALATALAPVWFGHSPLHHFHTRLGPVPIGTPMLFDAGVFLAVIGVTLKLMLPLMKSVHGLSAFVREEEGAFAATTCEPIDIDPTRAPKPRSAP